MLKLFLPDVGPMPQSTDWLSMTDEELDTALVRRGYKPQTRAGQALPRLVILEKADLFDWLSLVVEHHRPEHSDLLLLAPVIARRLAMCREQLQGALTRFEEALESATRAVEAAERQLREIDENVRQAASDEPMSSGGHP